jgi:hypothetical protein
LPIHAEIEIAGFKNPPDIGMVIIRAVKYDKQIKGNVS